MDVLLTGGSGRVGTAITDHLHPHEEFSFHIIDQTEHPTIETTTADVTDYRAIRPEFEDKDAVIHLARTPGPDVTATNRAITWSQQFLANLKETTNVIQAAIDADVDRILYASSNHAVGMYEVLNAPDIYYDSGLIVDHTVYPRPDSVYGVSKVFGEGLGRLTVDAHDRAFYALRLGAVRSREYDHPYGDAERAVDNGELSRDDPEYAEQVARMKGLWQSRRDLANLVECCLLDTTGGFEIVYGVSDNDRRWLDITHAKNALGYSPQDNGENYDSPPE